MYEVKTKNNKVLHVANNILRMRDMYFRIRTRKQTTTNGNVCAHLKILLRKDNKRRCRRNVQ